MRTMKKLINHCPLWLELSLAMMVLFILISAQLIYRNYNSTKHLIITNYRENTNRILELEGEDWVQYMDSLANFCIQPYYDFTFTRIINQKTAFTADQIEFIEKQMYYNYYTRSDISDYEIYFLKQNKTIGKIGKQQHFKILNCDKEQYEHPIEKCIESPKNRYITVNDNNCIVYYHSLINISDSDVLALVKITLDPRNVRQMKSSYAGYPEELVILNDEYELLYLNSTMENIDIPDLLNALKHEKLSFTSNGETLILTSLQTRNKELTLVHLMPQQNINNEIGIIGKNLMLQGILICLGFILLIYPFILLFTYPLKRLSAQMPKVGEGDFSTQIHEEGSREICELSDSYNSMVRHIDNLIKQNYIAELNAKDAKLIALEAQLNPHFLYNTLQAISTEALLNDQMQIHRMITSLASNLRYTIKGSMMVPLKSEMDYVNNYIFLQKMRMQQALDFHSDIDPNTKDFLIPKISIQTMVENSILYGKNTDHPIQISVSAKKIVNTIEICVEDNGCGISDEKLKQIYESFKHLNKNTGNSSIGLSNLYSRLQILYNKPTQFIIDTKAGKYTKITLVLPITKNHSQDIFREEELHV